MFGYVVANADALSPEELGRYKGCYCGLCKALKKRHGELSRLTLNYDMTFLILLLTALYEPEETAEHGRCKIHPMTERDWWNSVFTDYAADLNVALAYFSELDDWRDERKFSGLVGARVLKGDYRRVREQWPRQCSAIETCMERLSRIEDSRSADPDAAANAFGELMGELFACREDMWAEKLRLFGQTLGRFIYMMDACVDLDRDRKHGWYNPLAAMGRSEITVEEKRKLLTVLIGECTIEFEKLPILQDVNILRNILYSGVWTQFEAAARKKGEGADDRGSV